MIVMKFGGSSVANAERIRHVAEIVKNQIAEKPILVLSAMGDTTDHLLAAADLALREGVVSIDKVEELHRNTIRELKLEAAIQEEVDPLLAELRTLLTGISLIRELTVKTKDYLVSFGERFSVRITAAYFNSIGIKALALDAWHAGFLSDSNFTSAELDEESWDRIPDALRPLLEKGVMPVITGFIAKDRQGSITTLGRGGSDLSATMIASAMNAVEVQVWKDVDGILTSDPRIVKAAKPVETVSYEEAAELAYFGAQVLHPRSMLPCIKTGTLVRVKNSYNPESHGSVIVGAHRECGGAPLLPVRAITAVKHVQVLDIVSTRMLGATGFLAHIFNQFLKWNISIDVIATSEVSVSLTMGGNQDVSGAVEDIRRIAEVECHRDKSIVAIICDVGRSSDILAACFSALKDERINVQMISQGASKVNISMICDDAETDTVVRTLHKTFFGV
jgi:aspartate kinase